MPKISIHFPYKLYIGRALVILQFLDKTMNFTAHMFTLWFIPGDSAASEK